MAGMAAQEPYVAASLLSTLTTLGLTTNLKLCLDAGEGDSYTSGQKWLDLSGNGYDFFRGADVTETTDDPTFNGVADALSSAEYWSFDAGDYFRYDTTNETWMNNLHKDNALFTLIAWTYPAGATTNSLFGTSNNGASNIGIDWIVGTNNGAGICNVSNGSGTFAKQLAAGGAGFTDGAWQFAAISVDEAGTYFWKRNAAATSAASAAYTSPSASAATYTAEIAAVGNGGIKATNTSRMAMFAAWEGVALTSWQLEQIYNKTRRRFGV